MPKSGGSELKMGSKAWSGVLFVASVLVAIIMTALFQFRIIDMEGMGYFFLLAAALAVGSSFYYWRALDEPSREAHKFAVFWGLGFAFAIVIVIGVELMYFRGARDFVQGWVEGWIAFGKGMFGREQGAVGFYLGILASTLFMGLGYILVWIGWWASQRIGTRAD